MRKKEIGTKHQRKLQKYSTNFNEIFTFFLKSYRKGLLTFCGSDVDVKFDIDGPEGKNTFRMFDNGYYKGGKEMVSCHPNIVRAVIIGKKKMSLSRKGKYVGKNNPFFGKKHSKESIKKQIEKRKGSKRSEEFKLNRTGGKSHTAKPVYCYNSKGEFIKKYDCARDTSIDGFDWNSVSKVCRGIRKTHKNHVFSFKSL